MTAWVDLPPAGVYSYATSGGDSVTAFGGSSHTYPATTTITVTDTACGYESRWDALQERYRVADMCAGGGLTSVLEHTDFYDNAHDEDYACRAGSEDLPPADATAWSYVCDGPGDSLAVAGSVIGAETLVVDGQPVAVWHVRRSNTWTGNKRGTGTTDEWRRQSDGLLVKTHSEQDAVSDTSIGPVTYKESYNLMLTALEPQR